MIDIDKAVPSKAGLRSVLDVLKIQMNFWPTLEANFTKLHSQWGSYAFQDTSEFLEFSLGSNSPYFIFLPLVLMIWLVLSFNLMDFLKLVLSIRVNYLTMQVCN